MDIKTIEDIAEKTGMGDIYDRPRLRDTGDGNMGWCRSGELTPYGQKLIAFANAVEIHIKSCRK